MAEVIVTFKIKGTHNKQIISKYFNIILKCNFCGVSFLFPSWETSSTLPREALSILTEPLSTVFFESHLCRSPGNDRNASSLQNASQAALFSNRKACTRTAYSVFTKYQTNGEMENKALMIPRAAESFSHLAIQQWQMFIEQLLCKRPSLCPWDMPVNEQK